VSFPFTACSPNGKGGLSPPEGDQGNDRAGHNAVKVLESRLASWLQGLRKKKRAYREGEVWKILLDKGVRTIYLRVFILFRAAKNKEKRSAIIS